MAKKLILLDANHLMHRAYWAIQRNLATSKGEQTNAVFGVASMLLTLLTREQPDAVVACFDEGKETYRHQLHDAYKAGRAETPDDFYAQIPRVHQCLQAFGIPVFSDREYEADDLLGTLARRGAETNWDVIIVTGDRDLFQMVADPERSREVADPERSREVADPERGVPSREFAYGSIRIAIPNKGYTEPEYLDAAGVEKKLGVTPAQVPDYKGLVGDASDNLKGVKGIGPKTAERLLTTYKTLESVYEHLGEITGSTKAKLAADRESAFFCRDMARLVTTVSLSVDLEALSVQEVRLDDIRKFFDEMEFFTLKTRLKKLFAISGDGSCGGGELDRMEESRGIVTQDQLPMLD